jgi:stress response protein YsnF
MEVLLMSILDKLFGTEDDQNNQNNQNGQNKQGNQGNQNGQNNQMSSGQDTEEGTLQLRKEEIDINKNKVETGEVTLSKKVVEEQQCVDVPVNHEEVVIERRAVNNQPTDSQISSGSDTGSNWGSSSDSSCPSGNETIRIPLTEEQVQVDKHTVVTGEVTAYKRDVEQTQKVSETLKREEAQINKTGNAAIATDSDYNTASSDGNNNNSNNNDNSNFQ